MTPRYTSKAIPKIYALSDYKKRRPPVKIELPYNKINKEVSIGTKL
jgi:hypothetical protein